MKETDQGRAGKIHKRNKCSVQPKQREILWDRKQSGFCNTLLNKWLPNVQRTVVVELVSYVLTSAGNGR